MPSLTTLGYISQCLLLLTARSYANPVPLEPPPLPCGDTQHYSYTSDTVEKGVLGDPVTGSFSCVSTGGSKSSKDSSHICLLLQHFACQIQGANETFKPVIWVMTLLFQHPSRSKSVLNSGLILPRLALLQVFPPLWRMVPRLGPRRASKRCARMAHGPAPSWLNRMSQKSRVNRFHSITNVLKKRER